MNARLHTGAIVSTAAIVALIVVTMLALCLSGTSQRGHAQNPTPLPTVTADVGSTPTGQYTGPTLVTFPTTDFDGTFVPATMVTPDVTPLATRTP